MRTWNSKFRVHMLILQRCSLIIWWVSLAMSFIANFYTCWFGVLSTLLDTVDPCNEQHSHAWNICFFLQVLVTSTSFKKLWSIIILQPNMESNKICTNLFLKHKKNLHAINFCVFLFYFILFGGGGIGMKTSPNSMVTSLFERESNGLSMAIKGLLSTPIYEWYTTRPMLRTYIQK